MKEQNAKNLHEDQEGMDTSDVDHPSMKFLPAMLAVIITAVVVGGGMYWWQSVQVPQSNTELETTMADTTPVESEMASIIPETQRVDYALSIEQEPFGESTAIVKDAYNEGAGFSLHFPSSWGFVNVIKRNLTDGGGNNPPQRASYTFTSEFRPHTHYFTIIISFASEKDNDLVTQGNRIYMTEDDTYYYNYNPSTEYCVEAGECKADEVEEIKADIQEVIDSFELL